MPGKPHLGMRPRGDIGLDIWRNRNLACDLTGHAADESAMSDSRDPPSQGARRDGRCLCSTINGDRAARLQPPL